MSTVNLCACRCSPAQEQKPREQPSARPPCCCEARCTCPHCHSGGGYRAGHHHHHHQGNRRRRGPKGTRSSGEEVRCDGPRSARRCTSCMPEQAELGEANLLVRQQRCDEARVSEQQRRAALAESLGHRGGACHPFYTSNTAEMLRRRNNVAYQAAVDAEYDARRRALQAELHERRGEIEAMRRSREELRMEAALCASQAVQRGGHCDVRRGSPRRPCSADARRPPPPSQQHASPCPPPPPQEPASPPPPPASRPSTPQAEKACPCSVAPHAHRPHSPPPPPPPPHHHQHRHREYREAREGRCGPCACRASSPCQHTKRPPPPPPPPHHSCWATCHSSCQPGPAPPRAARPCAHHLPRTAAGPTTSACPSCGHHLLSARDIVSMIAAGELENSVACPACGFIGGTLRRSGDLHGSSPPAQATEAPAANIDGSAGDARKGNRGRGQSSGPWLRSSSAVASPAASSGRLTNPKFGRKVFITDDLYRDRRARYLAEWEARGAVRRLLPSSRSPSAPLPERTPKWLTVGASEPCLD